MLNVSVLKRTILKYRRNWLFYTGILIVFLLFGIGTYHTKMAEALMSFPKIFQYIMDVEENQAGLIGYLSAYQYGGYFFMIPLLYEIILVRKMIIQELEDKSMLHLIAAPVSRKSIISTKAFYLAGSLAMMFFVMTVIGLSFGNIWAPGELMVLPFVLLNVGCLGLHICISGLLFLISIVCKDGRMGAMLGVGISVFFYFIKIIRNMGIGKNRLDFFTIFTLFDRNGIISGDDISSVALFFLILFGFIFYKLGIHIFEKRDLPF